MLSKLFLALREIEKLKLRTAELIIIKLQLKFLFFRKEKYCYAYKFDLF